MEVTLSGRLGGPEVGVKFQPEIVQARARLKFAFAELSIDGLETIDVELWISGSLTEYCPEGISSSVRFYAKKKSVLLAVCVGKDEATSVDDDCAASAIGGWLTRGFESAKLPRSAGRIDFSGVAGAVNLCFA